MQSTLMASYQGFLLATWLTTVDVTPTLAESVILLPWKVTPVPLPILCPLEASHCTAHTSGVGVILLLLEGEYLHQLLEILLYGKFVCSYTFIYISMESCIFSYTLRYIYIVAQIVPALAIEQSSSRSRLPHPFDIPPLLLLGGIIYYYYYY